MGADGTLDIADHRERHACVAGEILPEAQARSLNALVAALDLLQFGTPLPESVHAGLHPVDAMGVQIKLNERCSGKISRNRPGRHSKDGRELRKRHRLHSTHEIECRTPHPGDLTVGAAR
jgi:hypothetical protein